MTTSGDAHPRRSEYRTAERCHILEYVNTERLPSVSVARARVEPGVTTELHALTVEEWYVVKSGRGLMEIGGNAPFPVGPGDAVRIAPGVSQRITSIGAGDLLFLCICFPRYTPGCYRSLE